MGQLFNVVGVHKLLLVSWWCFGGFYTILRKTSRFESAFGRSFRRRWSPAKEMKDSFWSLGRKSEQMANGPKNAMAGSHGVSFGNPLFGS